MISKSTMRLMADELNTNTCTRTKQELALALAQAVDRIEFLEKEEASRSRRVAELDAMFTDADARAEKLESQVAALKNDVLDANCKYAALCQRFFAMSRMLSGFADFVAVMSEQEQSNGHIPDKY